MLKKIFLLFLINLFVFSPITKGFYPNVETPSPASMGKIAQKSQQAYELYIQIREWERKLTMLANQAGFKASMQYPSNTYAELGGDITTIERRIDRNEDKYEENEILLINLAKNKGYPENQLVSLRNYLNHGTPNEFVEKLKEEYPKLNTLITETRNLVTKIERDEQEVKDLEQQQEEMGGFVNPLRVEISDQAIHTLADLFEENLKSLANNHKIQAATSFDLREEALNELDNIGSSLETRANLEKQNARDSAIEYGNEKIDSFREGDEEDSSNEDEPEEEIKNTVSRDDSEDITVEVDDERIKEIKEKLEENPEMERDLEKAFDEREIFEAQNIKKSIFEDKYATEYQQWFPRDNMEGWELRNNDEIIGTIDKVNKLEEILDEAAKSFEEDRDDLTPAAYREGEYNVKLLQAQILLTELKTIMDLNEILVYHFMRDLQQNLDERRKDL